MKIALITDLHFGVRNNNEYLMRKQEEFFSKVFFPYIDEHNIKTVINLGDVFDKRSVLSFTMYDEAKKFFFDEMKKREIEEHIIIGNHDTQFRNTNFPNSPQLILQKEYQPNIYPSPKEVTIFNEKLLFIPWVNVENLEETNNLIKESNAKYLFGHLEIKGFQMLKGQRAEHGFDRKELKKFRRVFSGHFHHRSQEDNVWYLGNPYETNWSDYGNKKGFHILDLSDHSLEFIENPFTSHIIVNTVDDVTEEKLAKKIVKIDLTDMTNDEVDLVYKQIEKFQERPEKLLFVNKINFVEQADANTEDLVIMSTKDIMNEYVTSMETDEKKYDELKKLLSETYDKAIEVQ